MKCDITACKDDGTHANGRFMLCDRHKQFADDAIKPPEPSQLDRIEDSLQAVRKLLIQLDKNIGERHLELLERLVVNDKAGG